MTARLIEGMPAATYHADPCEKPSLSSGIVKILANKAPVFAHRAHPRLGGMKAEHNDTFDIGTVAHAMLLEEDESGLIIVDADDWRTKAAKEKRVEAHAAGKVALLERHADKCRAMVAAARAFIPTSEIAEAVEGAVAESVILWSEDDTHFRIRKDWLSADRRVVIDYKTTEDASPEAFCRTIPNLGYHLQGALYSRGVYALTGVLPKFVFLAQETEAPYACALYGCDPVLSAVAEAQLQHAIETWETCMSTGKWPAYGSRVHWADAPGWLQAKVEALGGAFERSAR